MTRPTQPSQPTPPTRQPIADFLGSVHLGPSQSHKQLTLWPLIRPGVASKIAHICLAEALESRGIHSWRCSCEHVDRRMFIERNRLETLEHRMKRAREDFDPFIERVLAREHEIISPHRECADVVITRDYDVEFVTV